MLHGPGEDAGLEDSAAELDAYADQESLLDLQALDDLETIEALTPATLGLRVHDGGPSALVVLDGELDVATCSLLQALLDDLLRTKRAPKLVRLVVETSGIVFVDASGISPLLHARAVITRRSGKFELRTPSSVVTRLLSLLALDADLNPTAADD